MKVESYRIVARVGKSGARLQSGSMTVAAVLRLDPFLTGTKDFVQCHADRRSPC